MPSLAVFDRLNSAEGSQFLFVVSSRFWRQLLESPTGFEIWLKLGEWIYNVPSCRFSVDQTVGGLDFRSGPWSRQWIRGYEFATSPQFSEQAFEELKRRVQQRGIILSKMKLIAAI